MTVTIYPSPGTESYRSTRFAVSVNGTATYTYGVARAAEFGVTDYWTFPSSPQHSWVTVATDEAVTAVVSLVSGTITTARVFDGYHKRTSWSIVNGTVVLRIQSGDHVWVEVNGDHGQPCFIFCDPALSTPSGTTYDGSQLSVPAGQTLIFPPGVHTIGQQFPVGANAKAFLQGGAWVIGSFDLSPNDNAVVDGDGVISGEWTSPEAVRLIPAYLDKIKHSGVYSYHATIVAEGQRIERVTIVNPGHGCVAIHSDICRRVKCIAPWFANCTGLFILGNYAGLGPVGEISNCFIWSCDDAIDLAEYHPRIIVSDCIVASSASSAFIVSYWPYADSGQWSLVRNTVCVNIATTSPVPAQPTTLTGNLIQAWCDGDVTTESGFVVAGYEFDGLSVEGHHNRTRVIDVAHELYPWGEGVLPEEGAGTIRDMVFRNIKIEHAPSLRSRILGKDASNRTRNIKVRNFTVGGQTINDANWQNYFETNEYTDQLSFDMVTPTGRSPQQTWSSGVTTLAASAAVKTLVVAPRRDGEISAGVSNNQSRTLASNRTASGGSTTTIDDSGSNEWTASAYVGHIVVVTAGTGAGTSRLITANTNDQLTVDIPFSFTPDGTTKFDIRVPSQYVPVLTDIDMVHTGGPGNMTWQSKALVNGVMTTRDLAYYSTTATSGTKQVNRATLVGLPGGDIRITQSAVSTGSNLSLGFWAGDVHDAIF